jgi:hypothetical protein
MIYKLYISYTILIIALKLKICIQKKQHSNPSSNTGVMFMTYTVDIQIILHKGLVLLEIGRKGIQPPETYV